MKRAWCLLAAGLSAGLAAAKPPEVVYRCGPEGREYRAAPCADGRAVPLDDGPSAAEQLKAREVALQQAALLHRLERERRARESQPGAPAIAIGAAATASAPVAAQKKKRKKTAVAADHPPPSR